MAARVPRQLSGGEKQRVAIARALAGDPDVVVADEPVSALDVSVQAAIINLLNELQASHGTTLLFISHDLSVVRYLADHVAVMYLGAVLEYGPVEQVFAPPYHPYSEALLSAVPVLDPEHTGTRIVLQGAIPRAREVPRGCPFATRCPRKIGAICDDTPPPVQRLAGEHRIACHIPAAELAALQTGLVDPSRHGS
jgi:peptide/nickel transport system ATP-binding protein